MVITNQEFWEGLPNDVRPVLEEILAEVTVEINHIAGKQSESRRCKVAGTEGVEILTSSAAEPARWHEVMAPVWNQFGPKIDKVVIDAAVTADAST